jgi:hypothetical protein
MAVTTHPVDPEKALKRTPEVIQKLELAMAIDCSIDVACAYAEISPQTLYNWLAGDPELKSRLERLRLSPILKAKYTVAKNTDQIETAKWLLERKCRDEYGRNQKDADAAKEAKSPAIAPRSAIYDFVSLRGYTDLSPREEKQPIPSEENTDETSN